ncbi:MAG: C-GCAxxG-C-C family protein [Planctomycetota bacterium]|jgi:hypothetical protein
MKLTRREMLEVVGITAGSCALSSCAVDKLATFSDGAEKPDFPWTYTELEPDITAQRAYHIYEKGRCMYGVFASVILQLAKEHGEPYRSFPVDMMRYGGGGTAGWGSLCGALNGSAALIGLFTETDEDLKILVNELFLWYEQTELPVYIPKKPTYNIEIPKSTSVSVLCHVSVTKWCKVSGHKAFSKPQKERCKRLTADTARKTVELLNAHVVGRTSVTPQFNKKTKQCRLCHTRDSELQNSRGKMSCTSCHSFNLDKHP